MPPPVESLPHFVAWGICRQVQRVCADKRGAGPWGDCAPVANDPKRIPGIAERRHGLPSKTQGVFRPIHAAEREASTRPPPWVQKLIDDPQAWGYVFYHPRESENGDARSQPQRDPRVLTAFQSF